MWFSLWLSSRICEIDHLVKRFSSDPDVLHLLIGFRLKCGRCGQSRLHLGRGVSFSFTPLLDPYILYCCVTLLAHAAWDQVVTRARSGNATFLRPL
jgi:hypothetical protein